METSVPISARAAYHRSVVANAALRGDEQAADDARRDLRAELLAEHVTRVVEAAPPLTAEQRERLVRILRPGGGHA